MKVREERRTYVKKSKIRVEAMLGGRRRDDGSGLGVEIESVEELSEWV